MNFNVILKKCEAYTFVILTLNTIEQYQTLALRRELLALLELYAIMFTIFPLN